jgi:hypothetical protein
VTRGALVVLVLAGCWRSTPAQPPPVDEPFASYAPADADVDPPLRRDPTDAPPPIDAPPPALPDPQRDCPSGRGMVARVIGLSITGSSTQITIGAGHGRGVAADWSVSVGGHPCTMVRVDQTVTRAACAITPDMVKAVAVALLCAP